MLETEAVAGWLHVDHVLGWKAEMLFDRNDKDIIEQAGAWSV